MLPDPPERLFASDNASGVHPAVMAALAAANDGHALAYGDDPWTQRATDRLRDLLGGQVEVVFCWGGTGANVVGLGCLLAPWQAVVCPETAHIAVDECGAPERFCGSKLLGVPTEDGKLRPEQVFAALSGVGVEHHSQPRVVSVTQATERGTVYSPDELAALADASHRHGLVLHLDGARIANAVASLGRPVREVLVDTGVDVVSFGATKNGAMYGEAVVFLTPELGEAARFVRKQAAQLPSKTRFVAAQFEALLTDDLWLRNAAAANAMATRLAEAVAAVPGVRVLAPPEANSVFATLPREAIAPLQEWSPFWVWDHDADVVRWMTSFDTAATDVDRFAAGVAAALDGADDRRVGT